MFRKANVADVLVLQQLLEQAWRVTYQGLYTNSYIERVIEEYYNQPRLTDEVTHFSQAWSGYYVYEISGKIVGCIGGGIEKEGIGSVYVFYLDPAEKRKGYGSQLLNHFTMMQKQTAGIVKQTVSVAENNQMALPFYFKQGFVQESKRKAQSSYQNEPYYSLVLARSV